MIAAVMTAYKPDSGLINRFSTLLGICDFIVVSDNTPGGCDELSPPSGFIFIHNLENIGLGPALNIGITEARKLGARIVLLFDQDSTPSENFVRNMISQLEFATIQYGLKCCIGPTHVDDRAHQLETNNLESVPTGSCQSLEPLREVACLPTSGMIFRLDALHFDEGFADDLFLDLVDFEWCWRLRENGWHFFRTPSINMFHRLGEAQRRFLGITFHVPAPYRHYFQFRDTLRLSVRGYVPNYSKARLLGVLPFKFLAFPFILDNGFERVQWMLLGLRDAIFGVRGIGAAHERLSS